MFFNTFAWQEHIRFLQTEMLPDIVRRVDRRQPACRSALPQAAFLPRKNSVGLFGEGKSDDDKEENRRNTCVFQGSMTQSASIYTVEKRVCPCQTKVVSKKVSILNPNSLEKVSEQKHNTSLLAMWRFRLRRGIRTTKRILAWVLPPNISQSRIQHNEREQASRLLPTSNRIRIEKSSGHK